MIIKGLPSMAVCLFCLVSCAGEPTGGVSGKVTYKGAPVTAGSISLHMASKGVAQDAKLDGSGTFVMVQPLPAGTYDVSYVPPTPEPTDPAKGPPRPLTSIVPKRYNDPKTSGISVEVKGGTNEIPIEFKD
jgi:hypothetical protein